MSELAEMRAELVRLDGLEDELQTELEQVHEKQRDLFERILALEGRVEAHAAAGQHRKNGGK